MTLPKWSAHLPHAFLWQQATSRLETLEQQGEQALVVWDESGWEKPETERMDELCSVRSSKAYRLTRLRRGYYRPIRRPVFVPGLHCLGLLLLGASSTSGPPVLAATRWWTTRGPRRISQRRQEGFLLVQCIMQWGQRVIHIFDRDYAGAPWLAACLPLKQRFVVRWPAEQYLRDEQGRLRKPWQIARGRRTHSKRWIWDARRRRWRLIGVLMFPVTHPELPAHPLWLAISRPGKGHKPWYLVTNQVVESDEQAWRVVFYDSRRWQLEMSWRYLKSELGLKCSRLRAFEVREKLLLMAALAYGFLLTLLSPAQQAMRTWLLARRCPRTGKRAAETPCPLYRLRLALSRLWVEYPPQFALLGLRAIRAGPAG